MNSFFGHNPDVLVLAALRSHFGDKVAEVADAFVQVSFAEPRTCFGRTRA